MGARKTTLNMALRRDRWQGQATALGPARPFSVSQKRANASSESLVKGCLKRIRGVHSFSRGRHLIRCADEGEIRLTILVFASPAARSSISSILRAKIRPTGPVNTARGAFREGKHVYVNFGFRPETSPRRHPVSQGPVSQGPVERSGQGPASSISLSSRACSRSLNPAGNSNTLWSATSTTTLRVESRTAEQISQVSRCLSISSRRAASTSPSI